jgi:hypothetical protein
MAEIKANYLVAPRASSIIAPNLIASGDQKSGAAEPFGTLPPSA